MAAIYSTDFAKAFGLVEKELEYNPKWANGTGYLDHIVKDDIGLACGEVARFIDDRMRRAIVVGTPLGNAVCFERYTPAQSVQFVVVCNVPKSIRWIYRGALNEDQFSSFVGYPSNNIGENLRHILGDVVEGYVERCQ